MYHRASPGLNSVAHQGDHMPLSGGNEKGSPEQGIYDINSS